VLLRVPATPASLGIRNQKQDDMPNFLASVLSDFTQVPYGTGGKTNNRCRLTNHLQADAFALPKQYVGQQRL
jgi:hypothetical protein